MRCQVSPLPGASMPSDQPDVAVPGADGGAAAVGVEIEAGQPHLAVPRIVRRVRQHIDGERLRVRADDGLGLQHLRPASAARPW